MGATRTTTRIGSILSAVALVATLLTVFTAPAQAGPVGDPERGELTGVNHTYTYSPDNDWGVTDYDPGSVNFQYDSLVFAMEQIGDRIYVGGKFRKVTNGVDQADQAYLAAFDANTGAWISEFRPTIDWSVFSLKASPDGERLFVGGEFSTAGAPNTAGFAALDPVTGDVDTSFDLRVTYEWAADAPRVHDMEIFGDWLYLGGSFTHLRNGGTSQTERLGRVSLTTGEPDTTWRPKVTGGAVWEVEISPTGDRVYAGGLFENVQGASSPIFAVIDPVSGALVPGLDRNYGLVNFPHGTYPFVATIQAVGDKLWVGGQRHNFVFTEAADLTPLRTFQTNAFGRPDGGGGDFQGAYVAGDVIFGICHCWGYVRELDTNPQYERPVDAVLAFDVATGDHLDWYAPDMRGDDGGWSLHMAPDKCLWIGGDINRAGGQVAWNLVRQCPTGGPQPPGGVPPLECIVDTLADGRTYVRWTDTNANGYDLIEDGVRRWHNNHSAVDASPGTTYRVQAFGGPAGGQTATCAPFVDPGGPGPGFTCTVTNNANGSVSIVWDNLGANGYDLSQDGGPPNWNTSTSFTDFTPGTDYTVTAWGGGVGGTTTSCTNPNPGGGGWDCTVANNPNGSVTITWGDIGATGYDLSQDGAGASWHTAASFTDFTPGTNYSLTAWGGGVGGTTTSCTNPNPGGGGWNCSVSNNVDGSVTITWADIGANGYDVSEDGGAARWVVGTTTVDQTPGQTYQLTAWGNGVGGTTTTC